MDLTTLLRTRAEAEQDAALFTFLTFPNDGEDAVESVVSYAQLDARARSIAAALQQHCKRGDRAVLLYPPSLEYIAAFFGCLYAGVIATPAYPPDPSRLKRTLPRLRAIVSDAKASVVLTTKEIAAFAPMVFALAPDLEEPVWLATDPLTDPSGWRAVDGDAHDVAFLQYTSGSTGDPKGVVLTHANLLANERMITLAFQSDRSTVGVGWLPLYHDMGLIGNVLQPIAVGFPCVLMSPLDFLRRPVRWLDAISRHRGTVSGGPNFAYDLCVRRVDPPRRARLDLSSWRLAFNGAEPVRADTLRRFAQAFGPAGFRAESFYPCYGLAEATLLVTGSTPGAGARVEEFSSASIEAGRPLAASSDGASAGRRPLVGCGRPVADERVLIVEPTTRRPAADGHIGEIWVCGENVASGYWQRRHEAFGARVEPDDGRSYLRTGDLGFVRGGELFVTGRGKDLLIVRGRNIYPQDVERTVEDADPSVRRGCVACFAVEAGGEERLVVVAELDRRARSADAAKPLDAGAALAAIRREVALAHELVPHAIVLIESGSIPKTSSGKIQRFAARQAFLTGDLEVLASDLAGSVDVGAAGAAGDASAPLAAQDLSLASTAAADVQRWLIGMAARALGVDADRVDPEAPFASLGLDSMSAVELAHVVEAQLDIVVPLSMFLGERSLRAVSDELSRLARDRALGRADMPAEPASHAPPDGPRELMLSGNQESLWYLQELEPDNAAYNLQVVARMRGRLDEAHLRAAVGEIVRRHPVLRTTYRRTPDGPRQVVHPWLEPSFTVLETGEPVDAILAQASRLTAEPFDLSHGPMLRITLWRRSHEDAVLMIATHHVAIDLWSVVILLGELRSTYARLARGAAPSLEPSPATYEQFVAWQQQLVDSPAAAAALAYWKQHVGDAPPLELPTDRVRPTLQTFRGGLERFTIDPALGQAVVGLARREGVTPYAVMLAAYAALLHRFSGQSTFAIGTPTSGRDRRAFEDIVGYFVNTIPLRADLQGAPTFVELVRRMRAAAVDGLEHAWIPFSRVAAHLGAGRDRSRSPVFQTMFAYEQAPRRKDKALAGLALSVPGVSVEFADVTAETALVDSHVSVLDLSLVVVTLEGAPSAAWMQYNADLFDRDTIGRMIACFQVLLEAATRAPETRVAHLPILEEAQRRMMVEEWNATDGPYDPDLHIHHLFEENARLFPDKVAVEFEQRSITYGGLNERANVLARELRRLGCGRGTIVGICVERSIEMIVGLAAIVKSGAGFLPIDESYPADRLTYMFEDSRMSALVTHSKVLPLLPAIPESVELVFVDAPRAAAREDAGNLDLAIDRHDTFCILYTSGSTGRPKGVVLEHIGMVNHMRQQQGLFGLCRESRMLQYFSMSGDGASIGEIWPALGAGATIVMTARREDSLMPGEPIVHALRANHINFQLLPPVVGAMTEPVDLPELEMVSFGGDALSEDIVKRWGRGRRVHNMWGPTEATMITVAGRCFPEENRRPPIGRPLLNTTAYVLDAELQPVPIGVVGELHIGGVALARGYFARPALTAEKFIPDPFGSGERLYKTGDLARWLPDGRLDCLGRIDSMVKVYSQRIDLGEVESVLRLDPAVVDAVVIVREDSPGDKRLVAYVIASGQVSDLRALARERLPAYMVPAAIVMLDRFPLSPYGKVDRKAMPAPQGGLAEAEYRAPRNPTEETLAGIWQKVLKVDRVGILDNFYDLGGNSLLATQVVSRVQNELGVEIALRELFDATIAELAQGLAGRIGRSGPSIPRRAPAELSPLSFAQSRLWFLDRLEPGSAAYNVPGALRLRGRLDVGALRRCFDEVVRRHESLRTTFEERDDEPVQRIHPSAEVALPVDDLSGLEPAAREARAHELVREEATRSFDLSRGPLVRARLVRLAAEDHVLLFTMHHIVSDGWSMGVLVREVTALYGAYVAGQDSPLPELPIQYPDYAAWQREWLEGEELERQLGYWTAALEGMPLVLELPTDRPRPPTQTFRGATLERRLGAEVKRAVQRVSRRCGATEFMTLLGAFGVLLGRHSGQSELVIGSPIANRTRQETEGLIGFFVNTLALGLRVDGRESFEALLKDVKERTLGAYAHQDLPFERLVEALKIKRDMSRSPVFQVMFALQNTPAVELELPGLEVTPLQDDGGVAKFDLILTMDDADEGYSVRWEYNTDLFDRETIERMADHHEALLDAALAAVTAPISSLGLATADERRRIEGWEGRAEAGDAPPGPLEHLERWVDRSPDATAVVSVSGTLSYRELDRRSNQLARYLQRRGVARGDCVALCMDRSPEVIVAIVGILKAGAAYLPLEVDQPAARMELMLADARVRAIVSTAGMAERLPGTPTPRVLMDAEAAHIAAESDARHRLRVAPADLAYVMYTSGSTGAPKGVGVVHRAITDLVVNAAYLQSDAPETFLQAAPLAFDASTLEIWGALLTGGRLALYPDRVPTAAGLRACIAQLEVTTVWLTTALFNAIVDEDPACLEGARRVFTGGDALSAAHVRRAAAALPHTELHNGYGPTECTVLATTYRVPRPLSPLQRSIPIGTPIDQTRVLVLTSSMKRAGVGEPGELHIGGPRLARGYVGRPDLTAERFVPDPTAPGERLYRSGDLVRWRADGTIDFIGRGDEQVKIRGFRIELGEVESALRQVAGVRDGAVVARELEPGDRRLVAYVVGAEVSVGDLRAALKRRLPDYMVPSAFVVLDALPLTPSGKVDRRALPAPDGAAAAEYVAPRNETERRLAGIFAEVLMVERVGVRDNFFDVGGHSLLATQVVSRVQNELGLEIALRELFDATIAQLAQRLVGRVGRSGQTIPRRAPAEVSPLSFAQSRLWFLDRLGAASAAYDVPGALRLRGRLDVGALERCLEEVVRRHESLRTTFEERGGEAVQRVHPVAEVALPVDDLSALDPASREGRARELVREEATRSFDLSRGPLVRARLVKLAAEDHVLMFTMHHIVSDGWSMGVLFREVTALYGAYVAGRESPLPELPIQYPDYAAWQREWLEGEELERQLGYWTAALEGMPFVLDLPTDRPRPPTQTFRGATVERRLGAEVKRAVQGVSRRCGATEFMTLLGAFGVLLGRHSGQEELVIGSPIANRTRQETEGLIGFFVNTLALGLRVEMGESFEALLNDVKERTLDAYAHQDLPFERLVEALKIERDATRSPVFQVMFVLQNTPVVELELPGLEVTPLQEDSGVAKFDLALVMSDADDGYSVRWEYNTDLFDRETIERMADHHEVLLDAALAAITAPISSLGLTTADELRRIESWEGRAEAGDAPPGPLEHLERWVDRSPDATAVVSVTGTLSYRELDRRSNQLARYLQRRGVARGDCVALCMDRSQEVIVAIVGILKAGAAYVPLDIDQPAARMEFMLANARVRAIVSTAGMAERLPPTPAPRVLMNVEAAQIAAESDARHRLRPAPADLAYVMYTSGSTGMPKGVGVVHRAITDLVVNAESVPSAAPETFLQAATLAFDASTVEIWGALLTGGRLALYPDRVPTAAGLRACIAQFEVTTVWLTTALFNAIVDEDPACLEGARRVFTGGEVLSAAHVRRAAAALSHTELHNGYGPTECTVLTTTYRVPRPVSPLQRSIPIGRPVYQTKVLVLTSSMTRAGVGELGELYIGGPRLARGYVGRPDLTAERFVPDPTTAGERLYRSGDLVRWRADGTIDFIGRGDGQVKIRGFRIELGEIESALRQVAGVRDGVVVIRKVAGAERRIVAYVVGEVPVGDVRAALKRRLPEYMVPNAFIVLEALPLTANGKVDRRALPAPEGAASAEYVAPRSQTEQRLASIFAEVLKVERVGVRDNFFELGGHSLLATRLVSRVAREFDASPPLASVFAEGTVEAMARDLARTGALPLVPLRTSGGEAPLFLVHPVGGSVAPYRRLTSLVDEGRPVFGLQSPGLLGEATPLASLDAIADLYAGAMRRVSPRGPYLIGGWSLGGVVANEIARRLHEAGHQVGPVILIDSYLPTSRDAGPKDEQLFLEFALDAARASGENLDGVRGSSPETLAPALLDAVGLSAAEREARFAVYRANMRSLAGYRPTPWDGHGILVRAGGAESPADEAWRESLGSLTIHRVGGADHYTLLTQFAGDVGRCISAALARGM